MTSEYSPFQFTVFDCHLRLYIFLIYIILGLGGHIKVMLRTYSWVCPQGNLLAVLSRSYVLAEIKLRPDLYKASALITRLLFWTLCIF